MSHLKIRPSGNIIPRKLHYSNKDFLIFNITIIIFTYRTVHPWNCTNVYVKGVLFRITT